MIRKAYPLHTDVLLMDKIEARIMAVTFYPSYEKYLLSRIKDSDIIEEWYEESYFTVGKIKKIGFTV